MVIHFGPAIIESYAIDLWILGVKPLFTITDQSFLDWMIYHSIAEEFIYENPVYYPFCKVKIL